MQSKTEQHRTWVLTYLCYISGAQFAYSPLRNVSADDKKAQFRCGILKYQSDIWYKKSVSFTDVLGIRDKACS